MTTKQTTNAESEARPAHTGIYAALAAAQAEMGRAMKDTPNPHFRSKYADLASVQDACMPALTKHGFSVFQPTVAHGDGWAIKTVLAHESGETLECLTPLIVDKNNMQGFGSAITYARRYGLMCMSGVAPDDDDGNAAAAAPPKANGQRRQWQPGEHAAKEPESETPFDTAPERTVDPDHEAAVISTLSRIEHTKKLDKLAEFWKNLPRAVQHDQRAIDAKEKRKHVLSIQSADQHKEIHEA